MGYTAQRDRIWRLALLKTVKGGKAVYPDEMADELDVGDRTVRSCLNMMASSGFLNRDVTQEGKVRFLQSDNLEWTGEEPELTEFEKPLER